MAWRASAQAAHCSFVASRVEKKSGCLTLGRDPPALRAEGENLHYDHPVVRVGLCVGHVDRDARAPNLVARPVCSYKSVVRAGPVAVGRDPRPVLSVTDEAHGVDQPTTCKRPLKEKLRSIRARHLAAAVEPR